MNMVAWAASAAGTAAALLVPPGVRLRSRRLRPGTAWWLLAVPLAAVALLPPRCWVLVALAAGVALGGLALWRRRTGRREAMRTSGRIVESCEQLAAELSAGMPPGLAVEHVAADWPVLRPVAEAIRLDADVPEAFRHVAELPGAGRLRLVAAAWQVALTTGQGLAGSVDRVALELRAAAATDRIVQGELASARATAKLIAALPVAALALGSGVGGDPWHFLLGTPVGLAALGLGLLFGWAGLWWIDGIAGRVEADS